MKCTYRHTSQTNTSDEGFGVWESWLWHRWTHISMKQEHEVGEDVQYLHTVVMCSRFNDRQYYKVRVSKNSSNAQIAWAAKKKKKRSRKILLHFGQTLYVQLRNKHKSKQRTNYHILLTSVYVTSPHQIKVLIAQPKADVCVVVILF